MKLFFFTMVFLCIFKAAHGASPDIGPHAQACNQVKAGLESANGLANYYRSAGNVQQESVYKKIIGELSSSAVDLGCEGSIVRVNSGALGLWQRCTSLQVELDLIDDELNIASVAAIKSGAYEDLSGIYSKRGKLAQEFLNLGCSNLSI